MTLTVSPSECAGCGRDLERAKRVHLGQRYCPACAKRLFKPALCPGCGQLTRLYIRDAAAVCADCEWKMPCIRCGKEEYPHGKRTEYGPVCASCAHYFREPKPCALCGTLSTKLTRVPRRGLDEPVCPSCATRHRATCPACRFHRTLVDAPDGRQLCRRCLEGGERLCPECQQPMSAGRGARCETCARRKTLNQRVQMGGAVLETTSLAAAFAEFGTWLDQEVGSLGATQSIDRYFSFFLELDGLWGRIPTYEELLSHFGAEGLRRYRLPMRWLQAQRSVVVNQEHREQDSEQRRIAAAPLAFPAASSARPLLQAYLDHLMKRVETKRTTLRSVRLALTPVTGLLRLMQDKELSLPDQSLLDEYLKLAPGQRAAVSGFLNFLEQHAGVKLTSTDMKEQSANEKRRTLERDMLAFLRRECFQQTDERTWQSLGLAYFHDLPRWSLKRLPTAERLEDGSYVVVWKGSRFWLPRVPEIAVKNNRE